MLYKTLDTSGNLFAKNKMKISKHYSLKLTMIE